MEKFVLLRGEEKIRVGDNTWAEIFFEDDSKVKMYPNTELFLKEVIERVSGGEPSKKFTLSLFSGKIFSYAKEPAKFFINTSTCATKAEGVVQTEVREGATLIAVLGGTAEVADKKGEHPVIVPQHHQVVVRPQGPPSKPEKIGVELLNELNMEKRDMEKAKSFEQARQEVLQSLPAYHPAVVEEKFKREMTGPGWQGAMEKIRGIEKKREKSRTAKPEPPCKTAAVGKSVNYHGIEFNIATAETRKEYENRRSPENKVFLVLKVVARNNSSEQAFVFYQEEVRLMSEAGETIPLEDYRMETSFDPKVEHVGHLLFVIPEETIKCRLQFGKKSRPETEVELKL